MSSPRIVPDLLAAAEGYDAILCDVWGVIHDGVESFPAACAALAAFKAARGPVVLISNSPRPSADVVAQLQALGVPDAAWSGFVTSGDATRVELARRAPGPAWAIGPARDSTLYAGLGLKFAGPQGAAFICCTGLEDDEAETADHYRGALETAAARGLTMICANPDRVVRRGARLVPCAGALADLYESLGGEVVIAGKPHRAIYDLALEEATRLLGRPVERARVLCIGDGLATDAAGAAAQGLDLLFVAAGIHEAEVVDAQGRLLPERLEALLATAGARARFALTHLV